MISLQNDSSREVTVLSNCFIDEYMPRANGEFVKVYIYLLRLLCSPDASFSLEQMADRLLCTERDIFRALKYWESEQLMVLHYEKDQQLSGISIRSPRIPDLPEEKADAPSQEEEYETKILTKSASAASSRKQNAPGGASARLTPDRIRELQQDEDIRQLLYIAEQYLNKTLASTEMQKILYFYDEMHMSAELIEYLLEYCVGKGHKSIRYIETVAMAWTDDGITTVEAAKETASRFSKDYFTILKAMGITGRNPVEDEIVFMDTWLQEYGFNMPLIQEACSRTVLATGQASFQYTDKILAGWKKNRVHTMEDIRRLDAEHKKRQLEKSLPRQNAVSKSPNRFNNFHQRQYDFEEYEKRLLNQS